MNELGIALNSSILKYRSIRKSAGFDEVNFKSLFLTLDIPNFWRKVLRQT